MGPSLSTAGLLLVVLTHPSASLGPAWLDTELHGDGHKPNDRFFQSIDYTTKLNRAILPVFFRQRDACPVTQRGWDITAEGTRVLKLTSVMPILYSNEQQSAPPPEELSAGRRAMQTVLNLVRSGLDVEMTTDAGHRLHGPGHEAQTVSPGRPARRRRQRVIFLALGLALLWSAMPVPAASKAEVLRIGFTKSIFKNRNESDVLAAMKVWAQTLSREREIQVDPNMTVFGSFEQAREAVLERKIEALTLLLSEYPQFPKGILSGPYFRDEVEGDTHIEYVLLTHSEDGFTRLRDLAGGTLLIYDDLNASLAADWLNAELAAEGLQPLEKTFGKVGKTSKLSSAVLGVFFGMSDACLVSRRGFVTMEELNPQLSAKMAALAISPPVLPSLFCFRSDLPESAKADLLREVTRLHESVIGAQVLRVFKANRMSVVTEQQLHASLKLLTRWKQLDAPESGSLQPGGQLR